MTKRVFCRVPLLVAALILALTGCRGPGDSDQITTGAVTGQAVFADNANVPVTIELKIGYDDIYDYVVVTPTAGEVRFLEVTPGTYYLYASINGFRRRLRSDISVQAGRTAPLGDITITIGSVVSICPDTGYWLIDGNCTGMQAQGPAGTPGEAPTPYNGYWHIGGVNTNIPVRGPAGTPGSVVSICPDTGNWLIDGDCTGVPSQVPPPPRVETIAVNQNGAGIGSLEIPMGEYAILTATFTPAGATAPVIWTSDSRYMVVTPMAAPRFSTAVGESVMVRAVGPVADATITAMAVVDGASVFAYVLATTSGLVAHITIDFAELGNEAPEIAAKPFSMLDGYSVITLSQADFDRFYTIRWIFDGADIEMPFEQAELGTHTMVSYGGGTLALGPHVNGRRLGVGDHFLTLMATTEDGVPFSRRITFTVTL